MLLLALDAPPALPVLGGELPPTSRRSTSRSRLGPLIETLPNEAPVEAEAHDEEAVEHVGGTVGNLAKALRKSRQAAANHPEATEAEAQADQGESEKPKRRRRARETPPEPEAAPEPVPERHCFADLPGEDFAALAEAPLVGEDATEGWEAFRAGLVEQAMERRAAKVTEEMAAKGLAPKNPLQRPKRSKAQAMAMATSCLMAGKPSASLKAQQEAKRARAAGIAPPQAPKHEAPVPFDATQADTLCGSACKVCAREDREQIDLVIRASGPGEAWRRFGRDAGISVSSFRRHAHKNLHPSAVEVEPVALAPVDVEVALPAPPADSPVEPPAACEPTPAIPHHELADEAAALDPQTPSADERPIDTPTEEGPDPMTNTTKCDPRCGVCKRPDLDAIDVALPVEGATALSKRLGEGAPSPASLTRHAARRGIALPPSQRKGGRPKVAPEQQPIAQTPAPAAPTAPEQQATAETPKPTAKAAESPKRRRRRRGGKGKKQLRKITRAPQTPAPSSSALAPSTASSADLGPIPGAAAFFSFVQRAQASSGYVRDLGRWMGTLGRALEAMPGAEAPSTAITVKPEPPQKGPQKSGKPPKGQFPLPKART